MSKGIFRQKNINTCYKLITPFMTDGMRPLHCLGICVRVTFFSRSLDLACVMFNGNAGLTMESCIIRFRGGEEGGIKRLQPRDRLKRADST